MKLVETSGMRPFFEIVGGTERSQAAVMVLRPGQATGGDDNVHPNSDQWLYVVAGSGAAIVEGRTVGLDTGALLLIEAGEKHEVINRGAEPLVTINIYASPAY
jgi:mannose-6-phosphate isomerase-like protein (cupin superfamily)